MPQPYFVKPGYRHRPAPEYFHDFEGDTVWQPDVYGELPELAARLGATRIVDVGCGTAAKLVALHPRFDVVGIDHGPNIRRCRERYAFGTWIEHDLESADTLPVDPEVLRGAVIVCGDVIQHLLQPERLLAALRHALEHAEAVVLSTPDRELTWGSAHCGPPPNPCHVREWTRDELAELLRAAGFAHVSVGYTRSHDRDPARNTILACIFREASTQECFRMVASPEAYCVSLERRLDRRARLADALDQEVMHEVMVFPAFDAAVLNLRHPERMRGEVGCYLSHLGLLKMARARRLPGITIMEDDIVFGPRFAAEFKNFVLHLPDDWDVLYFGGWHVHPPEPVNSYVHRLTCTFGTTMVVFRASAIRALLEHGDEMVDQIDVYYSRHMSRLKFYAPIHAIAWQAEGFSDVREEHKTNIHVR
ncbi:MAG TPA: glycosyltransferase family 25 protein [Longimicrobiaceae bacterium]|nr:glycosyltransferase family 25 protein [Longimicrobiaceae bacterium]